MPSTILTYILIILLGLAVGSFLNVIILRFDELTSLWKVRSHCPKCKKEIRWYDLVPFFSFIILKARCRFCKKPISYQYPIVEALTALLFVGVYFYFGLTWGALLLAIIVSLLIIIGVYDALHYEIPDILSYLAILFALGYLFLNLSQVHSLNIQALIPYGYAVLIGGGFLGFLVLVSRQKWMGAGDILIGVLMGVLLGLPNILVALFSAFTLGSVIGVLLIATKAKKLKDAVPFTPFLIMGTLIALFWGDKLINWYLGYLGGL